MADRFCRLAGLLFAVKAQNLFAAGCIILRRVFVQNADQFLLTLGNNEPRFLNIDGKPSAVFYVHFFIERCQNQRLSPKYIVSSGGRIICHKEIRNCQKIRHIRIPGNIDKLLAIIVITQIAY